MKTAKKTTLDRTDRIGRRELLPLIRYSQTHKGTVAMLTRELTKRSASHVHRQLVEGWLHPSKERWIHPRLGMGLLLMKLWKEISAEQERERVLRQARKETSYDEPNPTGCC